MGSFCYHLFSNIDFIITSFIDALDLAQKPPISVDAEELYLKNERFVRSDVGGAPRSPF